MLRTSVWVKCSLFCNIRKIKPVLFSLLRAANGDEKMQKLLRLDKKGPFCVFGLICRVWGEPASSEHPNCLPDLGAVSRHKGSKRFFNLFLHDCCWNGALCVITEDRGDMFWLFFLMKINSLSNEGKVCDELMLMSIDHIIGSQRKSCVFRFLDALLYIYIYIYRTKRLRDSAPGRIFGATKMVKTNRIKRGKGGRLGGQGAAALPSRPLAAEGTKRWRELLQIRHVLQKRDGSGGF